MSSLELTPLEVWRIIFSYINEEENKYNALQKFRLAGRLAEVNRNMRDMADRIRLMLLRQSFDEYALYCELARRQCGAIDTAMLISRFNPDGYLGLPFSLLLEKVRDLYKFPYHFRAMMTLIWPGRHIMIDNPAEELFDTEFSVLSYFSARIALRHFAQQIHMALDEGQLCPKLMLKEILKYDCADILEHLSGRLLAKDVLKQSGVYKNIAASTCLYRFPILRGVIHESLHPFAAQYQAGAVVDHKPLLRRCMKECDDQYDLRWHAVHTGNLELLEALWSDNGDYYCGDLELPGASYEMINWLVNKDESVYSGDDTDIYWIVIGTALEAIKAKNKDYYSTALRRLYKDIKRKGLLGDVFLDAKEAFAKAEDVIANKHTDFALHIGHKICLGVVSSGAASMDMCVFRELPGEAFWRYLVKHYAAKIFTEHDANSYNTIEELIKQERYGFCFDMSKDAAAVLGECPDHILHMHKED